MKLHTFKDACFIRAQDNKDYKSKLMRLEDCSPGFFFFNFTRYRNLIKIFMS